VSQQLLTGSVWALTEIQNHLKTLKSDNDVMKDLYTNIMLREIFKHLKNAPSKSSKAQIMVEVQLKLSQIYKEIRQLNPNITNQEGVFTQDAKLNQLISSYQTLSQGRTFRSKLTHIKLLALMREQQKDIIDVGKYFTTEPELHSTYFERAEAAPSDISIRIEQLTTNGFVQMENLTTKQKLLMSRDSYGKGQSLSLDVKKGEEYKIAFPVAINETRQQSRIYNRYNSEHSRDFNEFEKLDDLTIDPVRVVACHNHVMFVSDDE